jgi:hypothetical protein
MICVQLSMITDQWSTGGSSTMMVLMNPSCPTGGFAAVTPLH